MAWMTQVTPEALNDIEGIKEHIAAEFGTKSADKIIEIFIFIFKRINGG